jgi:hypothetical protein
MARRPNAPPYLLMPSEDNAVHPHPAINAKN